MAQEGITQRYKKEVAAEFQEQTKEGKEILLDIAKSHAFIYPLQVSWGYSRCACMADRLTRISCQGIYYSLRHPSLFVSIKSQIYKSALTSLVITVLFFALFYLPQVAFLAFTSGPLAFIAAIPVVLGEAALTSKFITKGLWLADAHEKLFDTVRHTPHSDRR